jgi:hypothetical protein
MAFEVFTGKNTRDRRPGRIGLTFLAGKPRRIRATGLARESAVPPLDREVVLMFDVDAKAIGIRAATPADPPNAVYRMAGTSHTISAASFLSYYGITATGQIDGYVNDDGVLVFPLDGLQ